MDQYVGVSYLLRRYNVYNRWGIIWAYVIDSDSDNETSFIAK